MFIHKIRKFPQKGFTLIDLIISLFIAAILLVSVFKAFISNIQTTSQNINVATLDDKSRKILNLLQSDLNDLNGNILNGTPTIFPLFDTYGNVNGILFVKVEKRLPILHPTRDWTGIYSSPGTVTLDSSTLTGMDKGLIKSGRYAVFYNFANFNWIPYLIETVSDNGDDSFDLKLWRGQYPTPHWRQQLLPLNSCLDYREIPSEDDFYKVCIGYHNQKENTLFYIADIVEYKLENGKLYRKTNDSFAHTFHPDLFPPPDITLIADNVSEFKPSFTTRPNILYPEAERITIDHKNDFRDFLKNLIPNNDASKDDCRPLLNYKCKEHESLYTDPNQLGYIYTASQISGVDLKLKVETESGKSRKLEAFFSMDQNHGNTSLVAFTPTKVVATKEESDRQYGSMIANPTLYGDPEGGASLSPYYVAAAPMISAVSKNEDTVNDDKLVSLCGGCPGGPGNCPSEYPSLCNANSDGDATLDYLDCKNASSSEERIALGCVNAQGTLVDRGLDATTNKLDPKIVFLNEISELQSSATLDLSRSCSGDKCPFSSYYSFYGANADSVFPMNVVPHFNPSGELDRFYVGVARLRIPDPTSTYNYLPKYHSAVFAIDTLTDPLSPQLANYKGSPVIMDTTALEDIASVSSLQIREEGKWSRPSEYMYLSSHETDSIMFRKRSVFPSTDDNRWSQIQTAFNDIDKINVKYTWLYYERLADDTLADRFLAYPENAWDVTSNANIDDNRITAMLAHDDGRIYFTTAQRLPDQLMDGDAGSWFYDNEVTYKSPIITSTGELLSCKPGAEEAGCTIAANTEKPIHWDICLNQDAVHPSDPCYKTTSGNYSSKFPKATSIVPSYDAKLKVAFKKGDTDWEIRTVANLHDTATGLTMDPKTGDIIISAPTNIKAISYDEMNINLAEDLDPPNVDLGLRRYSDDLYTANNVVNAIVDPRSPETEIEFKKLSGINVYPNSKRLNIVFADMINREVGYVVQQRNPYKKQLFAQVVLNESSPNGNLDRNMDIVVVHTRGTTDIPEKYASWLLPFKSTKTWGDPKWLSADGQVERPIPAPIPMRPPSNITDYSSGGAHLRNLSDDPGKCYADPTDTKVCSGGSCVCGQDLHFRSCEGDVLSQISIGLMGRQEGNYGCGVGSPAPYAAEDPIYEDDGGGGGSNHGLPTFELPR